MLKDGIKFSILWCACGIVIQTEAFQEYSSWPAYAGPARTRAASSASGESESLSKLPILHEITNSYTIKLIRLRDLIADSGQVALGLQSADGSMPAGYNGPYYDEETPVRNTAHWAITFMRCHEHTGKNEFKIAA